MTIRTKNKTALLATLIASLAGATACSDKGGGPPGVDSGKGPAVTDPAVRACDLLLDTGSAAVGSVRFSDSLIGRFKKEGPRLAVSFTVKADAPPSGKLAWFSEASGQPLDASAFALSSAQCYDRLGAKIADPGLTFH